MGVLPWPRRRFKTFEGGKGVWRSTHDWRRHTLRGPSTSCSANSSPYNVGVGFAEPMPMPMPMPRLERWEKSIPSSTGLGGSGGAYIVGSAASAGVDQTSAAALLTTSRISLSAAAFGIIDPLGVPRSRGSSGAAGLSTPQGHRHPEAVPASKSSRESIWCALRQGGSPVLPAPKEPPTKTSSWVWSLPLSKLPHPELHALRYLEIKDPFVIQGNQEDLQRNALWGDYLR
ncbi:hypothetical protein GGR53DRAFT_362792 [Hypoxylon sp. FL1150]|nr:hypothetical protein GGR53DRAFT_362792 [Hypoxylon sp. FL1150]